MEFILERLYDVMMGVPLQPPEAGSGPFRTFCLIHLLSRAKVQC